jgi:hypothetical protein
MAVEVGSVSSWQRHRLSDHMHSTDATAANFVLYVSELPTEYILDFIKTIKNIYGVGKEHINLPQLIISIHIYICILTRPNK